jgi:hypothetical protein
MRRVFPWRGHPLRESRVCCQLIHQPEPLPPWGRLGCHCHGPTHDEPPLLHEIMMGGPIERLPMTPNGEGRTNLPFLVRYGVEVSPTSTTTILRQENPPAYQAMMTISSWQETLWLDDNLCFDRQHTCREAVPGGQAATVAGPSEPLQHELLAKGALVPPPPHGQWGMAKANVGRAMVSSPPLTIDEVDRLNHQLTEIHTIDATQLVQCTHWCRSS